MLKRFCHRRQSTGFVEFCLWGRGLSDLSRLVGVIGGLGVHRGALGKVLQRDEGLGDSGGYHRAKHLINGVITLAWERRE